MIAVDSQIRQYFVSKSTKSAGMVAGRVDTLALPEHEREEWSREREVDGMGDSSDGEAALSGRCSISAQCCRRLMMRTRAGSASAGEPARGMNVEYRRARGPETPVLESPTRHPWRAFVCTKP